MGSFKFMFVVLLSVVVFGDSEKIFQKCCPKGQSLAKVTEGDEITLTVDNFKCVESDFMIRDTNFDNLHSPLITHKSVTVEYGIPENCTLQIIELRRMETQSANKDVCYDRLVLDIMNETSQNLIPKTVALKCDDIEVASETQLHVLNIRKCCLKGQFYDTEFHLCRNGEDDQDESFLERLVVEPADVYEVENGMHCKLEEFAVELKENKFRFRLDASKFSVSTRSSGDNHDFAKGNWCLDQEYMTKRIVARVCTRSCKAFDAFCMRKCCPVGEHYRPFRCGSLASECVPNTDYQVLFNISSYMNQLRNETGNADFGDVIGFRSQIFCKNGKTALNNSLPADRHSLLQDGRINWALGANNDYCMETIDKRRCDQPVEMLTVMCFVKPPTVKDFRLSLVLNCLSTVCLFLTLVVHCSMPELQNLHGLNLICHVCTMMFGYICLARVQYKMVEDANMCTALGYGIYFGFVAAFAWLNVMCLDIWWTLGSVRNVQVLDKRSVDRRRFLWYSLYAWGISITLTLVTYLFDRFPLTPILDANIGDGMCWFGSVQNTASDWPHYIFFVIPMGIITGVNFILWVVTFMHCARVKGEVHRLQAGSVGDRAKRRFRINNANMVLTIKLWVVMGAGWICELLSTIFDSPQSNVAWLFTILDMINELQGVFIFIILVFKSKVYYLIRKRLGFSRTSTKPRLDKDGPRKNGATSSGRTSSTFLSRTISHDERVNKRVSVPNEHAKLR